MKKSKRLQPITRLAEIQEQEAAQKMGACKKELKAQNEQLEKLKEYRDGYMQRFQTASMRANQLIDYRLFLDKLNRAIKEQERLILQATNLAYDKEKLWKQAHQHSNGMQKLTDKAVNNELFEKEKKEQAEQDDRSARRVI